MPPAFDQPSGSPPGEAPDDTDAIRMLKRAGLRVTPARLETLAVLRAKTGFMRPESLFKLCAEKRRSNLSTIYRTLTDLAKSGLILTSRDGDGHKVYAAIDDVEGNTTVYLCLPDQMPIPLPDTELRACIEKAAAACGIGLTDLPLSIVARRQEGA